MGSTLIPKINLSIPETVTASGIGRTTLFALIKSGELQSIKIGSRRYVPVAALNEYLERLRAQQNGSAAA